MKYKVTIKDDVKIFKSEEYNYKFNLLNGYFMRWGKQFENDPTYAPFGPEILDCEITTKCSGIKGKTCEYCYKSNTPAGANMSFYTFKKVIEKVNVNNQLTSVAFGLGSTAEENPDLWKMCEYLRSINVIPNGTVANVSNETAERIAKNFGAVAVSYHGDYDILADNVARLNAIKKPGNTLDQINIHFVLYEENFDECVNLFKKTKEDERFKGLNAIVLLGLKKCGRAKNGAFNRVSDHKFKLLVNWALNEKIGIGFDSCSANRLLEAVKDHKDFEIIEQLSEPCESKLFSYYVNTEGKGFPCSFCEALEQSDNILECNDFINDIWNSKQTEEWRTKLLKKNRSCPHYDV
jgi:hypothetical protein